MKKILLASAVTVAGLSIIATASHAADKYRQNSAYCRLSNTTDILCRSKEWKVRAVQGLAVTASKTTESLSKYCRDDSTEGDPLCAKKVKYDAPANLDAEEPVYVGADERAWMEIEDPVWVDAEAPVNEAGIY
jgi:hypothetical protein